MIWKVFTFLYLILLLIIFVASYQFHDAMVQMGFMDLINFAVTSLFVMSIIGIFISLGWKKQFFTKNNLKGILAIIITLMILSVVSWIPEVYAEIFTYYPDKTVASVSTFFAVLINLVVVNLLYLPFYIGLYKYNQRIESFDKIDKPIWKSFALFFVVCILATSVVFLLDYQNWKQYNIYDFLVLFSGVYDIAFIIGFSFDIQILNKMFWKITAIPYVVFSFVMPFFISDALKQKLMWDFTNIPTVIFMLSASAVVFYALYKYAFAKQTDEN